MRAATLSSLLVLLCACGAKSDLARQRCESDSDCSDGLACSGQERCDDGECVAGAPFECDDGDPCTADSCVESERPSCELRDLRVDEDGDGFDVFVPSLPTCGDDCDDTNARIHPSALEVCNATDDDCDEGVDEGASITPTSDEHRLTFDDVPSSRSGLVYVPETETYAATYWDYEEEIARITFLALDEEGEIVGDPVPLTHTFADAFGGPLVWTGRELGIVWEDRRDGDFEIYFNRLAPDGATLGPDLRLTVADDYSIYPDIGFTGDEFVVVWQDARHQIEALENYEIYMTFLDRDGFEIDDDLRLTNDLAPSEAPRLAIGGGRIGVSFVSGDEGRSQAWFLATDLRGGIVVPPVPLSRSTTLVASPQIAFIEGAFVVVWEDETEAGDRDVFGARISLDGAPSATVRMVAGGSFSRTPSVLAAGEDVLLAFIDDREGVFAVYVQRFSGELLAMGEPVRATNSTIASTSPRLSRGGASIGVLYNDQRDGNYEVYFTRLVCSIP